MKNAIALVACAPLVTWLVTVLAAHPALVSLVPPDDARIGALVFVALVMWAAARELLAREPLLPMYRAGLSFGVAVLFASAIGFDPIGGSAAALVFCAIAVAGNRLARLARFCGVSDFVTAWLASGAVLCATALAAMLARRPALLFSFSHGRAIGIFENPNELALFTLALIAVALAALIGGREVYARPWIAAVALALAVVTLVATGSRSGEASFAFGAVALAAMLSRRRMPIALVALALIVAVGASLAADRRHNPAENASRLAAWQAGIRTVALFPLTGVGVGAYVRFYPYVRAPDAPGPQNPIAYDPHDFYLAVASEAGLVGLVALGWTIFTFAREARQMLRSAPAPGRRFMLCVLAGLIAVGIDLLFNAFALAIVLWAFLAAFLVGAARPLRVPPGSQAC